MIIGTKTWIGGLIALEAALSVGALAQPYPGPPPGSVMVGKFSTAQLKSEPLTEAQMKTAVDYIESHVQMPKGAKPIEQYARFYAQDKDKGFIHGAYVPVGEEDGWTAGIHLVDYDKLPVVADGGCSFIDIVFIPKIRALRTDCHGEA